MRHVINKVNHWRIRLQKDKKMGHSIQQRGSIKDTVLTNLTIGIDNVTTITMIEIEIETTEDVEMSIVRILIIRSTKKIWSIEIMIDTKNRPRQEIMITINLGKRREMKRLTKELIRMLRLQVKKNKKRKGSHDLRHVPIIIFRVFARMPAKVYSQEILTILQTFLADLKI